MNPIEPVARLRRRATSLYGTRRVFEEQEFDHLAAAWRQVFHRFAHHLLPLQLRQYVGWDRLARR